MPMTPDAKEARREYQRKWDAENREKRREYMRRYWERKAAEKRNEKEQIGTSARADSA